MRGKKRAYTFIRGTEVLKFGSAADAREHFKMYDQKWPSRYIKTGWHGWEISPEIWESEIIKKKNRKPVEGKEYKKPEEYMTDENELYYIGAATGFICIVTRKEFLFHVKVWNEKIKRRIKYLYGEQKKRYAEALESGSDGKISSCKKEMDKRRKMYEDFMKIENRPVIDCYKRITGGTVIIVSGDEPGMFWERSEYVSRCEKYGLYPHDR